MDKNYLLEAVGRAFDTAVYNRFGEVALGDNLSEDGNTLTVKVFDIDVETLNELSETEKEKHIVVNESYDLSNFELYDNLDIMDKINRIVTHFEVTVYSIEDSEFNE